LGPCLYVQMGETALMSALNAWGSERDRELRALRADLSATQAGVAAAFDQAQAGVSATLQGIIEAFRAEMEVSRQQAWYEAQQSVARLEMVVTEARARFGEQDARFATGLAELAQRLQAADAWAQAEPTRVAAMVHAAPAAPPWLSAPVPSTPPDSPGRLVVGPALSTSPAWAAWAANRGTPGAAAQPHDAWAAAAAAAHAQQQPPGLPEAPRQHFNIATPAGGGGGKGDSYGYGGKGGGMGGPRELRINTRDWGNTHKLEVTTTYEGFQVWKDRATMFLSKERPDVRALLGWAEGQSRDELAANLGQGAARLGVHDLEVVEYAVHDGIKAIIVDGLLGRARNCAGRGCELWRSLVAEWSGDAPQLRDAKARSCLDPPRCKDIGELWARLPAWERLGEEVETSGFILPEWMRRSALEKLLPTQLLNVLISRSELQTYAVRLAWVKTQMEHSRGVQQAAAYRPGAGKDASGDVYMSSVEASSGEAYPEPPDGLAWALANAMDQGDWAQAESIQVAIFALKGGKGGLRKGLGKGKAGKGDKGGGKGAAAADFNGTCNHCGIWGHRRSECRRLDKELAAKGGPKGDKGGKKGGKGGPKGGKGPPADPLAECAADDDWAAEYACDEELADDEWLFANALCSLAPGAAAQQQQQQQPPQHSARAPAVKPYNYRYISQDADGLARRHRELSGAPPRSGPRVARSRLETGSLADLHADEELSLLIDAAAQLNAVTGEVRGGRVVEAVIDSGAVHSVTPPGLFPGKVVPSPWSRAGRGYRAANGTAIKNLGQVPVPFITAEGHKCRIPFQVAEVEQPLIAVSHLTGAGNIVELGDADGCVKSLSTGRTIGLERRGGVYIMKMFIPNAVAPPFHRQGA
jgi:hypothetical protein